MLALKNKLFYLKRYRIGRYPYLRPYCARLHAIPQPKDNDIDSFPFHFAGYGYVVRVVRLMLANTAFPRRCMIGNDPIRGPEILVVHADGRVGTLCTMRTVHSEVKNLCFVGQVLRLRLRMTKDERLFG